MRSSRNRGVDGLSFWWTSRSNLALIESSYRFIAPRDIALYSTNYDNLRHS